MSVGCRSLTDEEVAKLKQYFNEREDRLSMRDYTLLFFSLFTGLRISETLCLKVSDVYNGSVMLDHVYLKREHMKGKYQGRCCVMNDRCKDLLHNYIVHYNLPLTSYLFANNRGTPENNYHLTSRQAERIFKKAFDAVELSGKMATHTTRKTFAQKCYEKLNENIMDLSVAMGHKSISSTQHYVRTNNGKIQNVVKSLDF